MPHAERLNSQFRVCLGIAIFAALCLVQGISPACASGPRWVTGPPNFTGGAGQSVAWDTWQPLYFTDPADLSASVNHAAADAMVAAAAGVWNVPTAGLTLAYGGALAEHVSSANAYLGANGPVFPADVQSTNYATVQIAVIYDSDGSVTDMLLGSGASSPAECLQHGITESVDSISPWGAILHAILVLNGRCTGPAPAQQLQMQYQLERAFGRVLGVGWSQTNDNVFTTTPQPTYAQAQHWPIMHPIDIICGLYTYQCMPQPFTLRDDDIAAITSLYPLIIFYNPSAPPPAPGKVWSYAQASFVFGTLAFPTGQGMQGVNIVLQRQQGGWPIPEAWEDVSTVTGYLYQQNGGNPVTGPAAGMAASMGTTDPQREGYYQFSWVPDIDPPGAIVGPMFVVITTQAINPLYTGSHSVGPYVAGSVSPSGNAVSQLLNRYPTQPYMAPGYALEAYLPSTNAVAICDTGGDGIESAPNPVTTAGWWTDVLCAHGHTAWSNVAMQAGRTATLEVTALDESGLPTTLKAMPLLGVWAATDATGILPTVSATPSAFNTSSLGMTATSVATATAQSLRFVVADARGDGRPDFAYQARVLYADSVQPAITSVNGGQITISGMGFRLGNQLLVNGVSAVVSSWSATTIVAVAPPESAFRSNPASAVDVEVIDQSTGGTTAMKRALTYGGVAPDILTVVSAPTGTVGVGMTASIPFAIRVFLADGVTPVVGIPVTFAVGAGSAQFGACGTATCVVLTDATGTASTTVTPTAFGAVTVQATAVGATVAATFQATALTITLVRPVEYLAAGATVSWTPQATVTQSGVAAVGTEVDWSASGALSASPASSTTNSAGIAQITSIAGPLASGVQATGQVCVGTTCANFAAVGVDPSNWRLVVVSGAGQAITQPQPPSAPTQFVPVVVMVTDAQGDPVAGATVTIHQTVDAAEMPCPATGACPIAPVLSASQGTATSDANGLFSVTPMQLAGIAAVTNIAVSAGTQGFVSLSLDQQL
jgi:hypothetical protein